MYIKDDISLRRLDKLGRIVIPAGIKNNLGIKEGTPLIIQQDGERIIITKDIDSCYSCGSDKNLLKHDNRFLCKKCIDAIANLQLSLAM